ncbi:MAG: NusG domain II-containing protein [Clostridiales bacterium]|nr:NusG domain II-containing protein [Candidatus Equinaster intestinalis]
MVKKKEIIIFAVILCLLTVWVGFSALAKTEGSKVAVTVDGKTEIYSLNENQTVKLPRNTVVIENGEVFVKNAECPNQICVKTGKISKAGEQIACLPNKVLVEIRK